MIEGGVRAGVPGLQHGGQGLAGVVAPHRQRMESQHPPLKFDAAASLSLCEVTSVASTSNRIPGQSRPPAGVDIASRSVSAACHQTRSRAAARTVRIAASSSRRPGPTPATRSRSTPPTRTPRADHEGRPDPRSCCHRRRASPPDRPAPGPGHALSGVPAARCTASDKPPVTPERSARSASSLDPACDTTPVPSPDTISLGRRAVLFTRGVPSYFRLPDPQQVQNLERARHFRVSAHLCRSTTSTRYCNSRARTMPCQSI